MDSTFAQLGRQLATDSLKQRANFSVLFPENNLQQIPEIPDDKFIRLSLHLNSKVEQLYRELFEFRGTYWVEVINNGSSAISQTRLNVPDALLVQINRPGKKPISQPIIELIDLGTLQPKESIKLIVWTHTHPYYYSAHDIRLTHDNGLGRLNIKAPASSFARWVDYYFSAERLPLVILLIIVIIWSSYLILPLAQFLRKHPEKTTELTNTKNKAVDKPQNE